MSAKMKAALTLRIILLDIHSDLEIYVHLKHEGVDPRKEEDRTCATSDRRNNWNALDLLQLR
jgi:hypothetical protein